MKDQKQISVKKLALLLLSMLFTALSSFGQQAFQFSQYMENLYILNPAAAGLGKDPEFGLGYRRQWAGLSQAPETFYFTGQTILGKNIRSPRPRSMRISSPTEYAQFEPKSRVRHALGVFFLSDEFGAFKKNNGSVSYAVHVPLTEKYTISFGTSAGMSNVRFDQNKARVDDIQDVTYANFAAQGSSSTNILDVNFGLWFYSDRFFLGYSAYQLLGNQLSFGENATDAKLEMYHNVMAGYKFQLNRDWAMTPTVLVKFVPPAPIVVDASVKFDYQDRIWFGASYRHETSAIAMFGLHINDMFRVGYSFDYSITSQLRNLGLGSHELMLGVRPFKRTEKSNAKF